MFGRHPPGSSANIRNRNPLNVLGKFFVDDQCTDCDLCRETAPMLFTRDDSRGWSYVFRQPSTAEELALMQECIEGGCTEAIGNTGDQHQWETLPPVK